MPLQTNYLYQAKAGQLRISRLRGPRWRLYAGDEFVASFPEAEDAVRALAEGKCKLPKGDWKAPADLSEWQASHS